MKSINKLISSSVILATMLVPLAASASDYPSDSVTMVIPFSAGGSNDGIGRYLASELSTHWGETVVVENRPGGGAAVGASYVSRAEPDGHTMLLVSGTLTVTAATRKNLPFDPINDLQPVAMAARGDMVFVSGSRVPMNSLHDLVREANSDTIFYGTTGVGSLTHLTAELFSTVAGIKMEPVHYSGGTDALVDIAGGRLDLYAGSTTQVMSTVENDMATPLAVLSNERAIIMPEVSTAREQGFDNADVDLWWGVFVPADTPADVVNQLNADIQTVFGTDKAKKFLATQGTVPFEMSVEEFSAHYQSEIVKWKNLVQDLGIETH